MVKIDSANYQLYREVYKVFWKHYSGLLKAEASLQGVDISSLPSPIEILADVEKRSKPLALKALRVGFTDMLQTLSNAPEEFKRILDINLKALGLPGYFQLYAEVKDLLPLVLKRGVILSIEEYYFIVETLNDTTSEITDEERPILNTCITDFELKQAGKR